MFSKLSHFNHNTKLHALNKVVIIFISILIFCSVSACGFQLRGYAQLPKKLRILTISPYNPNELFQKRFIRILKQNNVTILPIYNKTSDKNIPILNITEHGFKEETITYAPDGTASRLRLTFTLKYHIADQSDEFIVEPQVIKSTRDLNISKNTLLSDRTEQDALQETLLLETANKILQRLSI